MLCFSALVAGSFALGVLAANEIPSAALNAVRFWIAALVIAVLALATTGIPREAARAPWRYLVLGGLFAGYFWLMFEGLKTASAVSASAVFTLTPVVTALFGWILLKQPTTARMALALLIGGIGALWVIFRADWAAFLAFDIGRGEVIYFVGCVSHAIYTPMVRKLNRGEAPIIFSLGVMIAGALILTFAGWRDLVSVDWGNLPGIVWVTLIYLTVFATATTFVLLQFATLRIPSAKVMAYTYLTPSWVIIWQIALGHPTPPLLILIGIGLTVLALVLLLRED